MQKITYYELYECLQKYAFEKYTQREDLHKYIKQRADKTEYSPVVNFYAGIVARAAIDNDKRYFGSDLFEIHCEVLAIDSDFVKQVVGKLC